MSVAHHQHAAVLGFRDKAGEGVGLAARSLEVFCFFIIALSAAYWAPSLWHRHARAGMEVLLSFNPKNLSRCTGTGFGGFIRLRVAGISSRQRQGVPRPAWGRIEGAHAVAGVYPRFHREVCLMISQRGAGRCDSSVSGSMVIGCPFFRSLPRFDKQEDPSHVHRTNLPRWCCHPGSFLPLSIWLSWS
jgi:hypothetical protein